MKTKPSKSDDLKRGIIEASKEEQLYFESYPDDTRLRLKEVMERSREKAKEVVSK